MAGIQTRIEELERRNKNLELRVKGLNRELIISLRERDNLKRLLSDKIDNVKETFPDYHGGKYYKSFFDMNDEEMKEYIERTLRKYK